MGGEALGSGKTQCKGNARMGRQKWLCGRESILIEAGDGRWDREFPEGKLGKQITFKMEINKILNKKLNI